MRSLFVFIRYCVSIGIIVVVLVYAWRSPSTVPIPGLPVSWGGHCRVLSGASSGASIPTCLVWTDGPEDTRLVIGQASTFAPQLGAYGYLKEALIDFQLPGHPSTVRIAFDPLPSRDTFVTMPVRLQDPQATDVQRRLARTSTLVVEWDSPRPQRVSFALNGITMALEGLEHAHTTLQAESMGRTQTTR